MAMRLILDTVSGAELDSGIGAGRILRTGLIIGIPLPMYPPDPTILVQALEASGMPQKGDPHPAPGYEKWFCKRHIIRPVNAGQATVVIVYEYLGILSIIDSSTLSGAPTQLWPQDFTPLYVHWRPASDPTKDLPKLLTLNAMLPLRHITISQTIDHEASPDVLAAFKTVNNQPWMGLPKGYWLFSGIEGSSQDQGITYTYTAVLSTKQTEDWSQMGFYVDEAGHNVYVDPGLVSALRSEEYTYAIHDTVNGVTKVGMFDLSDFQAILGVPVS